MEWRRPPPSVTHFFLWEGEGWGVFDAMAAGREWCVTLHFPMSQNLKVAIAEDDVAAVLSMVEGRVESVLPLLRLAAGFHAEDVFWALLPRLSPEEGAAVRAWRNLPPPPDRHHIVWPVSLSLLPRVVIDDSDLLQEACFYLAFRPHKLPFVLRMIEEGIAPHSAHAFAWLASRSHFVAVLKAFEAKHGTAALRSVLDRVLPYIHPTKEVVEFLVQVYNASALPSPFTDAILRTKDMALIDASVDAGLRFGGEGALWCGARVAALLRHRGQEQDAARLMEIVISHSSSDGIDESILADPLLDEAIVRRLDDAVVARGGERGSESVEDACTRMDVPRLRLLLSLGYRTSEGCFEALSCLPLRGSGQIREEFLDKGDPFAIFSPARTVEGCLLMIDELAAANCPVPQHVWLHGATSGHDGVFSRIRELYPDREGVLPSAEDFPLLAFPSAPVDWQQECAHYYVKNLARSDAGRGEEMDWEALRKEAEAMGRGDIIDLLPPTSGAAAR